MPSIFRRKWFIGLVLLIIVAVVIWKVMQPSPRPAGLTMGNGRLEATETNVGAKFAGRLDKVFVREGDNLTTGQVVAQLDVEDLRAQLRAGEAAALQAREMARESQASLNSAISQQNLARVTYERTKSLVAQNFVSGAQLDRDVSGLQTAQANVSAARKRVSQMEAGIAQADAQVDALKANVNDSTLVSPFDGRVLYRLAEPGEVLAGGGRVLTILDMSDVYMSIFLSAEEAGQVKIGSPARIVLDALGNQPIPATVVFVSPRSQFTPKEVETQYEREKLMFRIKVKVDVEWIKNNTNIAKPGMPGVAWVMISPDAVWPADLQPR